MNTMVKQRTEERNEHPAIVAGFDLDAIPSQARRIAIVTGANTGLGYETTLQLARKRMKVIMACRSLDKGNRARHEIEDNVRGADLEVIQLDLGMLESVREFTRRYRGGYSRLDLLINNAGVMWLPYVKTSDGFETHFQVNHLGHFLLTAELLDMMPDTPDSRIVALSSNAHKHGPGRLRFEDLQWDRKYSRTAAYSQSKLANLMFAIELDRRLKAAGRRIKSVAAHPGASETDLARTLTPFQTWMIRHTAAPFLVHSVKDATLPTLMAALWQGAEGGDYFGPQGTWEMKGKPGYAGKSEYAQDEDAARRLWEVSEELLGIRFRVGDTPLAVAGGGTKKAAASGTSGVRFSDQTVSNLEADNG